MYIINKHIHIYIYIFIQTLPPKTYLLGSRYVLDIPFLTADIITCCNTTAGNGTKRWRAHTHTYLYIYIYVCMQYTCLVAVLWPSLVIEVQPCIKCARHCGQMQGLNMFFIFLPLIGATCHHNPEICLLVLFSRCVWRNFCWEVIGFKTQVVPFLFQRWHPFLEQYCTCWRSLWRYCPLCLCYSLLK